MKWLRPFALAFLLVATLANSAFAADFESLVAEGMKFYGEGRYDEAIAKFFEAKLVRDEPELVYNIARSYHKKGDCSAAKKHYEQFMARGDAPRETADKAQRYVAELGVCPTQGTLSLACSPASASVRIDGNAMGGCADYELEEGDHAIIVEAEGYIPQDKKVKITAGMVEATTVSLEIADTAVGVAPTTPGGTNWLGVGTLSAGGALIATTLVIDLINYNGNAKELEKYAVDDPRRSDFEDKYKLNQTIMYVTGGLGVAALAAGAIFLATDIGASEANPEGMSWLLAPSVGADGDLGATLRVAF